MPIYNDPLGRAPGEPLDPQRHSIRDLEMRQRANQRLFAALWQQSPRVMGGDMIRPEDWFVLIKPQDVPSNIHMRWVRAWDIAFTEKQLKGNDPSWTAGAKVGLWKNNGKFSFIIAEVVRWQAAWSTTKKQIISTARRDGTTVRIGVEGNGVQKMAYEDLNADRHLKNFVLRRLVPSTDKVASAQPWIDKAEAGLFYVVDGKWRAAFFNECEAFPNASAHNDQIDAVSRAYEMLAPYVARKSISLVKQQGMWQR